MGRDTARRCNVLKLGMECVAKVTEQIREFPKVKGVVVQLTVDESIRPVQQPLRRVPVAMEEKVEQKLKEAVQRDIIEPVVGPSEWISPVVLVLKESGEIRLCIDMRRANQAIRRENFPLPVFENFMTKLEGARFFSRLDLKDAYHQIELHDNSRYITTFVTHKGLFRYKRLLFGVNSAPEIFQRVFEGILAPCKNCLNYLDDIIIFGKNETEHEECLNIVLKTLNQYDVVLNEAKCIYRQTH